MWNGFVWNGDVWNGGGLFIPSGVGSSLVNLRLGIKTACNLRIIGMGIHYAGITEATIIGEFRNASGPVDPALVTVYAQVEGGEATPYVYPTSPEVTQLSTGRYQFIYVPDVPGEWTVAFEGTGDNMGGDVIAFQVADWPFS